jgi:GTP-binding protein
MQDGRRGKDEIIRVPVGTVIRDAETEQVLADLCTDDAVCVVARGGRGGRGNSKFKSATNQAPRYAEPGEPGEERWLFLELKLLADVGLIGLPNAGKSTLISRISAAKPKIAPYPFTTLTPHLGTVRVSFARTFVVADLPGLIAGAAEGKGLGSRFLRHVERTKLLVHLVDVSQTSRDPFTDFLTINQELECYHPSLMAKPQIIAASKIDLPGAAERVPQFQNRLVRSGFSYPLYPISSITGEGVPELVQAMLTLLEHQEDAQPVSAAVEGHCHS